MSSTHVKPAVPLVPRKVTTTATTVSKIIRNVDSSQTVASASSLSSNYSPEKTLFVFDWDDTLMPTTWLRNQRLIGPQLDSMLNLSPKQIREKPINIPTYLKATLKSYEKICIDLIEYALGLGDVAVVTNSTNEWIPCTGINFMPDFYQFLENKGIELRSARPKEFTGANMILALTANTNDWKISTFRRLALRKGKAFYSQIVSVGDGFSERKAALVLQNDNEVTNISSPERSILVCKAVRYSIQPTLERLVEQHDIFRRTINQWYLPNCTGPNGTMTGDVFVLDGSNTSKGLLFFQAVDAVQAGQMNDGLQSAPIGGR